MTLNRVTTADAHYLCRSWGNISTKSEDRLTIRFARHMRNTHIALEATR